METACRDGSYVRNCIIQRRIDDSSDSLFSIAHDGSRMVTKLDGYAIVPREFYENAIELAKSAKALCIEAGAFLAKNTGP